jgi:hypothetical protein
MGIHVCGQTKRVQPLFILLPDAFALFKLNLKRNWYVLMATKSKIIADWAIVCKIFGVDFLGL